MQAEKIKIGKRVFVPVEVVSPVKNVLAPTSGRKMRTTVLISPREINGVMAVLVANVGSPVPIDLLT